MTTHHLIFSLKTLLTLAVFSTAAGCSEKSPQVVSADEYPSSRPVTPAPDANRVQPVAPAVQPAPAKVVEDAADQTWRAIKDHPFTQRTEFIAALKRLETQVGQQIAALRSRRLALTADPRPWDNAMQVFDSALIDLKTESTSITQATVENWDERKAKVARACERLQEAYEKAKALTPP